ncbi:hypothetical protein XAUC_06190 [Xanthomonas citri pv. aurantifolii str. ICPB 10535]|nr:hypothetical protein XAUC_06190 [Xanthomonas citri pv. aurantifolii str. ICPB 10535]SON94434.1 conserved hypothetical protein [Xanthomonas citri pv. fuscans]
MVRCAVPVLEATATPEATTRESVRMPERHPRTGCTISFIFAAFRLTVIERRAFDVSNDRDESCCYNSSTGAKVKLGGWNNYSSTQRDACVSEEGCAFARDRHP